ncbi:MAG: Eco57I restriction-modification methylase domain-containing protein, partial [Flavobacteriales bacterium]
MTIDQLNTALAELYTERTREKMIDTARLLVEWMALEWPEEGRERLLTPTKENLKKFLVRHPRTNQPQFYRLTAKNQPVEIRLAVIKKIRKDQLRQLIDKETRLDFQLSPPAIQAMPSAPAYSFHLTCTPEFDGLYLILHQGDHKRVMALRRKLTQTQFQKIVPEWRGIGKKTKPEIAAQLWKSLDLKEVNKDFYKLIKEKYDDLIGLAAAQQPALNPEAVKQFAVRLIGRYIFCWFLKEKGVIPEPLLGSSSIRERSGRFTCDYLLRLFFNTLNAEVADPVRHSTSNDLDAHYTHIPYLNGGLFDRQEEDALFDQLQLDEWLMGFVEVLERFDFTVDESSSQYQLVAIDPEMLGRIFENLLATQNKDTEKAANQRKAFGAFYTPREIVDYMVNESLKAWVESRVLPVIPDEGENTVAEPLVEYKGTLFEAHEPRQTLLNLDAKEIAHRETLRMQRTRMKERIDKLFAPDCPENPFEKEELNEVRKALSEVTVLDPACGSGAFPMGVLLRLMELRQIVGHGHRSSYDLKNEILSKSIYGVDIMPMAVEIARLRAWLSLVLEAEYKPADKKNNFGIAALPNLDFKFVCANSLVDSGYGVFLKTFRDQIATAGSKAHEVNAEIQKLQRIRDEYFDPRGDRVRKEELKQSFYTIKEFIKREFAPLKKSWNLEDFLSKVDDWDPFDDSKPSTFFSPEWMFGITDGFDVVIGNPPYVQIQKLEAKVKSELEAQGFSTYERTGDLYQLFYERAGQMLQAGGVISYITSNKWMRTNYGVSTRQYLSRSIRPIMVIDFGMAQHFESATTYTNIYLGQKGGYTDMLNICRAGEEYTPESPLLEYVRDHAITISNPGEEPWIAFSKSELETIRKIEAQGVPLKDWDIKINRGILTGYNEAFILDRDTRNRLVKEDPRSAEIIRPILRGEDVGAFQPEFSELYLIATFPSLNLNIEDYPAIHSYLSQFRIKLEPKPKGFTGGEWKGRKAGAYEWFETQDSISYHEDFDKPKIIYPNMTKYLPFTYDESGLLTNQKCFIITGEYLLYLTGVLNSSLWKFAFRNRFPEL